MTTSYELYDRYEVWQALRDIRGSTRQRILHFIESLATNPFEKGDDTAADPTGRRFEVKFIAPPQRILKLRLSRLRERTRSTCSQ